MNRIVVIVICCFALVFFMASCDDQEKSLEYGSLSVEISNESNSKTIQPLEDLIEFSYYEIEGVHTGKENVSINKSFTSEKIKIDGLEVGNWVFTVKGYNKDKVLLAESRPHTVTVKTNGVTSETYFLDWIEGHGKLQLAIKVQTSKVSTIECQLYDVNGDKSGAPYKIKKEDSVVGNDGLYLFEQVFEEIPTGFYDAEIVMKDEVGTQIGKTLHPSIHIYNSLESVYEFSWKSFVNILPSVDAPKSSINDGETVLCNSKISLSVVESDSTMYYSFDGVSFTEYASEGFIDLGKELGNQVSATLYVYAMKDNLQTSEVAVYNYGISHELGNPSYSWKPVSGGYDCTGKRVCTLNSKYYEEVTTSGIYQIVTDSTCTQIGVGRYTATFNDDVYGVQTKDVSISKKPHLYDQKVVNEMYFKESPTCTTGTMYYKSCLCGKASDSEKEVFEDSDSIGHDFEEIEGKEPTCTEDGWYSYEICKTCGYTTYVERKAIGHLFCHYDAQSATCSEPGWNEYEVCCLCEYSTKVEIPALGGSCSYSGCKFMRIDDDYDVQVCDKCGQCTGVKDSHEFLSNYRCSKCNTWSKGPAGGYVFYDKGEYSNGWRFLEAAPNDLKVIGEKPTIDSNESQYDSTDAVYEFIFGCYRTSWNEKDVLIGTSTDIGTGAENTLFLVEKMKDSAFIDCYFSSDEEKKKETTPFYAANLCLKLEYSNYEDWFLPSRDELNLMYENLHLNGMGSFGSSYYWSSSENDADVAWKQSFSSGSQDDFYRDIDLRVRPIRAF